MGNTISSKITDIWLANHQRRVNRWLDNATEESVLDSLAASFFPGGKGYGGLPAVRDATSYVKETFCAYGSVDGIDQKRYWHEEDLRLFMSNRFSGPELNASIPILWRCFHFHAYFPFPRNTHRLDYSAFLRAIGFLAAEGTSRLGGNANGIYMDNKHPGNTSPVTRHLWMLFRSLASELSCLSEHKVSKINVLDVSDTEEDLMEVLFFTQPDDMCIMPAPVEELRPHARRILSSSSTCTYSTIPLEDFLNVLKLVLSVQLDKPEWGSHQPYFHTGRISVRPDPEFFQGAADAILRRSTSNKQSDVDWHSFQDILNVSLPDFLSQFRLIFTSFLVPPSATTSVPNAPPPGSTISVPYAQYLSLFLNPPLAHPKRDVFEEFARQEAHYALQTTRAAYSASPPTLNTTDLITALRPIKTGTLLLITGDAISTETHPPTRVTVGAFMPTPWDIDRERSFRASPPQKLHRYTPDHMLFELEPRHEIFRPEAANAWIMDLLHITASDPKTATKRGTLQFGPEGGIGLSVNFDSGIATLRNNPPSNNNSTTDQPEKDPPTNTYRTTINTSNPNHETTLQIKSLSLYDLDGHATPPFEEQMDPPPRLRAASPTPPHRIEVIRGGRVPEEREDKGPKVGGEELRRRIEGFGAGSSGR